MDKNETREYEKKVFCYAEMEYQIGSITALLILAEENRDLYFTEFMMYGMNDSTVKKSRDNLVKLGLVETYQIKNSKRIYVKLTPLGKPLAKSLLAMEYYLQRKNCVRNDKK